MDYLSMLIVFLAVSLGGYLIVTMFFRICLESLAKRKNQKYETVRRYIQPEKLVKIQLCSSVCAGVFLLVALLYFNVKNPWIYTICPLVLSVAVFFVPLYYFLFKEKQRKEAVKGQMLDFTLFLSRSVASGQKINREVIADVASKIGYPMKKELEEVLGESKLSHDLIKALENMNRRIPSEDLHLLVTAIRFSEEKGTPLKEVLGTTIEIIRGRTEFHGKLKNMTAQGQLEALVMSLAPVAAFVILYIIDPVLMTPLVTTGTGWCAIGVIAVLVSIGYVIINKIVSIEV